MLYVIYNCYPMLYFYPLSRSQCTTLSCSYDEIERLRNKRRPDTFLYVLLRASLSLPTPTPSAEIEILNRVQSNLIWIVFALFNDWFVRRTEFRLVPNSSLPHFLQTPEGQSLTLIDFLFSDICIQKGFFKF